MAKKPKTLKEIAIELLEKYEASETTVICEYSTNIRHSVELLGKEVAKYRKMIDKADRKTEPTISKMKQVEDEPKTQMKTQNSNLTFEKDECAKEYEELGLKELKELIKADRKTENNSEKPNNCEHITEDGVTCAKYPACDDCLDNPLNKVKGSERLVKGSEQTKSTISKMEQVDEPQTEEHCETCRHKDECEGATYEYKNTEWWCLAYAPIDEPQTDCDHKCIQTEIGCEKTDCAWK